MGTATRYQVQIGPFFAIRIVATAVPDIKGSAAGGLSSDFKLEILEIAFFGFHAPQETSGNI